MRRTVDRIGLRHLAWLARTAFAAWLTVGLGGCAAGQSPAAEQNRIGPPASASPSGNYLAARQAERMRDHAMAAQFLDKAVADDPANFELLTRAHGAMINDGRFAEAVEMARRILAVSQGNPSAQLTLAVDAIAKRNFDEARARFEGVPLAGINRIVAPLVIAWLAAAKDQPAAALNALRPLNEVEGFRPLHDYHAGLLSEYAGRRDAAIDYLHRAATLEGGAPSRIVSVAGAFFERIGRPDEAKAIYEKNQFRRNEDDPRLAPIATPSAGIAEAFYDIAAALRQDNSAHLSLTYARLALAVEPTMGDALLLVAEILEQQRRREEALALYGRVDPRTSAGWTAGLRMAETLHTLDRTEEAIALLDRMAAERPERIDPLLVKGQILRIKERFGEAVRAYDAALARVKQIERRHWSLFYARGIAHERAKQWAQAEADFVRALELEPDQPDVLNYLAYSWVDRGLHYERARTMLDRAVAQRPNSGHIVDSLGWVLYRTGKYQEAVPVLERAVELQPEDPVLLDHLGDAYWRVGRQLEAQFQWRRSLGNKPDAELKSSLERKLKDGLTTSTSQREN